MRLKLMDGEDQVIEIIEVDTDEYLEACHRGFDIQEARPEVKDFWVLDDEDEE